MNKNTLSYVGFVVLIIGVFLLNITRPPWQIIGLVITASAVLFPALVPIYEFINKNILRGEK